MKNYNQWLLKWFQKHDNKLLLDLDENYFQKGIIDSMGIIELIMDIEKKFDFRFSQRDFQDRRFSSVNGLSEIISEKVTP